MCAISRSFKKEDVSDDVSCGLLSVTTAMGFPFSLHTVLIKRITVAVVHCGAKHTSGHCDGEFLICTMMIRTVKKCGFNTIYLDDTSTYY